MKKKKVKIIVVVTVILVIIIAAVIAVTATSGPMNVEAAECVQQGYRYLDDMKYEQAVASFESAFEIDGKYVPAYSGSAIAYSGMGESEKAVEVLNTGYEKTESKLLDYMADLAGKGESLVEVFDTEEEIENVQFDGSVFDSLKVLGSPYYTWDVNAVTGMIGLDYTAYAGRELSLGSYNGFNVTFDAKTADIEFRATDGNTEYRYRLVEETQLQILSVTCGNPAQASGLSEIDMAYTLGSTQNTIEMATQLASFVETENTFNITECDKGIVTAIKWQDGDISYIYVDVVGTESLSVQFCFEGDSLNEVKYTCGIPDNLKSDLINMVGDIKK